MTFTISQGQHEAKPKKYGLYHHPKKFLWKVEFSPSCRYDLIDDDQNDENKLLGVGFFPKWQEIKEAWRKGKFGALKALYRASHHTSSARFAWKYNILQDRIDLFAYVYDRGINPIANQETYVGSVGFDISTTISLDILPDKYVFSTGTGSAEISKTHNKNWGFRLNLYFGGNETAPHDMQVKITKI